MQVRIVQIYDVRPIDWATGKRMYVPTSEWETCDNCGKQHARVYVLSDGRKVGRNCAGNICYFSPAWEKAEERRLLKESALKQISEMKSGLLAWVPQSRTGVTDAFRRYLQMTLPSALSLHSEHVVGDWIDANLKAKNIAVVNNRYEWKGDDEQAA